MSGELQTIPARHGVATFVPRGRTIKIINTYGKQVVSTWAFSLNQPPNDKEDETSEEGEKGAEDEEKAEGVRKGNNKEADQKEDGDFAKKDAEKPADTADSKKSDDNTKHQEEEADDPPEQAPEEPEKSSSQPQKKTWSSYLPSMPYRSKGATEQTASKKADSGTEKAQNEATSRKWSSYLPTGKGFSNYVPNVQMPDSKNVVSAFKASHYRDPNKSYAEQLYEFSKTPVGAGTLAAATGGGTASSLYAAYNAYAQTHPTKFDQSPMEYLSLPHTRASSHSLVPEVNDTLLTNLRNPIMTLIEDTTPGAHDTLTAACDANAYAALGVDKPEEHGSCAENLVLALKELNEKVGFTGSKAIGADITVNIAPTPLHLFMNAPIEVSERANSGESGAKGAKIKIEEPKGKKRGHVKFRTERDIVVVMSACPMDVGKQNGGKCMAANFMVEEAEDLSTSTSNTASKEDSKKNESKKEEGKGEASKKSMPKPRGGPAKIQAVKKSAEGARRDSAAEEKETPKNQNEDAKNTAEETPKPKKKPKKLERRGTTPSE